MKSHLTWFAHWYEILDLDLALVTGWDFILSPFGRECNLCVWKLWVAVRQPKSGLSGIALSFYLDSTFPLKDTRPHSQVCGWDGYPPAHSTFPDSVIGSGMGMWIRTRVSLQIFTRNTETQALFLIGLTCGPVSFRTAVTSFGAIRGASLRITLEAELRHGSQ